jgi:aminoglycoside 3-N-acetyltransferase
MSLKAEAHYALKRLTTLRFRQNLKGRVWRLRSRSAPLLKAWHGTYDGASLERELRARLPTDFEILMVHSSITDMRPMFEGTAQDVLNLLLRVVGAERTLVMPAFFFGTPELYHRDFYRVHARFDVRRTPSQMGLVSELFRRAPGVTRSLHPTHSVCALGPLAHELVATHHLSPWACGELSPFGIMGRRKTAILGLGTQYYRSLTQVHAMEEILGDQFPVPRDPEPKLRVELIDPTGTIIPYEMSDPLSSQFVLKLERFRDFAGAGDIDEWSFKGTGFYLTVAAKVDAAIRSAASRGHTLYVSNRDKSAPRHGRRVSPIGCDTRLAGGS